MRTALAGALFACLIRCRSLGSGESDAAQTEMKSASTDHDAPSVSQTGQFWEVASGRRSVAFAWQSHRTQPSQSWANKHLPLNVADSHCPQHLVFTKDFDALAIILMSSAFANRITPSTIIRRERLASMRCPRLKMSVHAGHIAGSFALNRPCAVWDLLLATLCKAKRPGLVTAQVLPRRPV